MFRRLIRHPRSQAVLASLLALYLRLVFASMRWTILGTEHLLAAIGPGEGDGEGAAGQGAAGPRVAVLASWHERLGMMACAWRQIRRAHPSLRDSRVHVLISPHRDGRLIAGIVRRFEVEVVHASSSRGGAAGLRGLLRVMASGSSVAITPDGPRGPRRQAAPGVAQLALMSGRPILPCAAASSRVRRLGSWDRMLLPLPFGRGVLVFHPPLALARGEDPAAALPAIAAAITAACDHADAWADAWADAGVLRRPAAGRG